MEPDVLSTNRNLPHAAVCHATGFPTPQNRRTDLTFGPARRSLRPSPRVPCAREPLTAKPAKPTKSLRTLTNLVGSLLNSPIQRARHPRLVPTSVYSVCSVVPPFPGLRVFRASLPGPQQRASDSNCDEVASTVLPQMDYYPPNPIRATNRSRLQREFRPSRPNRFECQGPLLLPPISN